MPGYLIKKAEIQVIRILLLVYLQFFFGLIQLLTLRVPSGIDNGFDVDFVICEVK